DSRGVRHSDHGAIRADELVCVLDDLAADLDAADQSPRCIFQRIYGAARTVKAVRAQAGRTVALQGDADLDLFAVAVAEASVVREEMKGQNSHRLPYIGICVAFFVKAENPPTRSDARSTARRGAPIRCR